MNTARDLGSYTIIDGEKKINLSSNDYLGLSHNRGVLRSASSVRQVSPCSSRLIGGNHEGFRVLESALAKHRNTEAALVYPTGYAACVGVLTALGGENTVIYSDELNHASIIDGCKLSRSKVKIFPHNNYTQLAEMMKLDGQRKMLVTEGVFSMDGDSADLGAMTELAEMHDAITVVDDSHGDFIRGPTYSGTPAESGVQVDVHVSSLSKALGCFGGYVATSNKIIELLINTSRQFIYTSALPESLCFAALTAIRLTMNGTRQQKLRENAENFFVLLKKLGFSIPNLKSQIIPVAIGDERKALDFSQLLFESGTFAQAIRYPTVAKGSARLRVSITSMHSRRQLEVAAAAFGKSKRLLNI